jgi:transcription initiation factor IIE alpha subunit
MSLRKRAAEFDEKTYHRILYKKVEEEVAFEMFFAGELDEGELAHILGVAPNSVRHKLRRLRKDRPHPRYKITTHYKTVSDHCPPSFENAVRAMEDQ